MQMELPGCVFPEGIKEGRKPFFEDGGGMLFYYQDSKTKRDRCG